MFGAGRLDQWDASSLDNLITVCYHSASTKEGEPMVPYAKRLNIDVLVWLLVLILTACALAYVFSRPAHADSLPAPIAIITPNSLPTYAHPSPSPSGPMTILPPASPPLYVYPSPSPSGPATVIVPNSLPMYVYPGAAQ